MKNYFKLLILICCTLLFCNNISNAEESNLTFLYINGSNNNDAKMKNWYINGVNKLHPVMKQKFEKNSTIKKWTKNRKLVINKTPQIFFWGYDSKTDLDYVLERLDLTKAFSSAIAYEVRSLLTQFLHDAIWVQKEHNMLPILDELNDNIIELHKQNQKVVLFGYSAGTFVTYQYFVFKMPYIKFNKLAEALNADADVLEFIKNNPKNRTCLSALMHKNGNLGVFSTTGNFVLNQNKSLLKENYMKLDEATEKYCAPPNSVQAVVNFASPIPLFYSDMGDKNYERHFYNRYMVKYLMENGIFYLTVNFREDPLGFPTSQNVTIPQMEEILSVKLENPTGVIYDNSKVWSKRSAIFAHTSYWSARKIFASNVVKTFVNGTRFLYDEKYQNKVIKKKKDPEVMYN